jgi:hypothetical protein
MNGGPMGPTRYRRHDVYSDVNLPTGQLRLIARNVSSSMAHDLLNALRGQGWQVELRDATRGPLPTFQRRTWRAGRVDDGGGLENR